MIYVITKLGLLFVYDLETATAVYRNRISLDPIFLTSEASAVGGFYAINRKGQVLLGTVNDATIIPFVSGQVNFNFEVLMYYFFLGKKAILISVPHVTAEQFRACCQSCEKRKPSWSRKLGK